MAVHYYDEEKIDIGAKVQCQVVVNHTVELTPEEIEEARQKAIDKVYSDAVSKMTTKAPVKKATKVDESPSLF